MSRAFMVKQAPFKPTDIGGCQLWLDASDTTTTILSGANVTTWRDKSGNGYHMNQLTATAVWTGSAEYPTIGTSINGRQTVNFTAQAGLKQSTQLNGVTNLFWLGRIAAPVGSGGGDGYFLLGNDINFDWHGYPYGSTFLHNAVVSTGLKNASPTSLYTSDANAITDTAFSNVYLPSAPNVSLLSVAGITGSQIYQGICYDRANHIGWCGDLAEVLVFSNALTTPQRQQVEAYLAQKWGLKATLPQGHPGTRGIVYPQLPLPNASALPYPSTYNPTSLGNCQLWLDAADTTIITKATSNVTQMKDKSPNSYTLTGASGSYPTQTTTLNGLPVISSAAGQYLQISNFNQNFTTATCFAVVRPTEDITPLNKSANGYPCYVFINGVGTDGFQFNINYANQTQTGDASKFTVSVNKSGTGLLYGALGGASPSTYNPVNTTLLMSAVMSGSSGTNIIYLNGTSVSLSINNSGTFPPLSITLQCIGLPNGASFGYDFAETIIYGTTLSTPQCQKVEGYLAWKWGLQTNLPGSHPYKNAAPTVPNALGISRPAGLPIPSIGCYPTRTYFLVTAGLVFHIDAGNPASYPGSGSTWYDLTTSGLNITLYGGPTYSSANGGSLLFVPTSLQYGQTSAPLDLPLWTLEAWTYYNGTNTGNWPNVITDMYTGNLQYCLGNTVASALSTGYLSGSWYYTSTYTITSGNWYHMVGTYDGTNLKLYVNGVLQRTAAGTSTPVNGGAGFRIMRQWDGNGVAYWGGNLSIARMYNRALSASEVNTNYQVSKARFSLS